MTDEGGEGNRRQRRASTGEARVRAPLTREAAWEYLLRVLARQSYTVAELRRKLKLRALPDETTEDLLARLQELRLVDDATYAEQYVASRKGARGRLALSKELRRKGIADDVATQNLGTLTGAQQLAAARALLLKNAWRYRPADAKEPQAADGAGDEYASRAALLKARAKAMAFLARRGFAADVAVAAIDACGWFDDG